MKLEVGRTVYAGRERFIAEIPDSKAAELGILPKKAAKKTEPVKVEKPESEVDE